MKPTIPEVLPRFLAYRGNSLHIVLDDGNVSDGDVQFCIDLARQSGDEEGASLGETLLRMSRTQRREIGKRVIRA